VSRSTTYPWLERRDDEAGTMIAHLNEPVSVDGRPPSPAEADRRLVIAQEIGAGRVFLAEDVRPLWEAAREMAVTIEEEWGGRDEAVDAFPAPEDWR
jgi:hypothetical protein